MTDWRVDTAKILKGAKLHFERYVAPSTDWDHDHCQACMAKFMESGQDVLTEGYRTNDGYYWICRACFHDLKDVMGWTLV